MNLVSLRIFVCQLRNLLVVLFFSFSRDVVLVFPERSPHILVYNAARFLRFSGLVVVEKESGSKRESSVLICDDYCGFY